MSRFLSACVAALALFLFSPAHAQWYGSVHLGGVALEDADVTDSVPGASATGEAEFDNGWVIGGALGYTFQNSVRAELEVSYRRNEIDSVTIDTFSAGPAVFTGLGTFDVDGDVDSLGLMANVWYDFSAPGNWKPYIGGGIGIVRVGVDIDAVAGVATSYSDDDWVFGYQLGAGVGFSLNPTTVLSLDYRFFATADPEFKDSGETLKAEYRSHNIMVGLRFSF
ncbi:MAG: porin family protein [Proteobacteria bacterium]|nr:porin family protein [Pseudomonadota bacterium]